AVAQLAVRVVAPAPSFVADARAGVIAAGYDQRGLPRQCGDLDRRGGRGVAAVSELAFVVRAPAVDAAVATERAGVGPAGSELGDGVAAHPGDARIAVATDVAALAAVLRVGAQVGRAAAVGVAGSVGDGVRGFGPVIGDFGL